MCVMCAAVPMAVSVGIYAKGKRAEQVKDAIARNEAPPEYLSPETIQRTTLIVVGALVTGAAIYHTILAPKLGV